MFNAAEVSEIFHKADQFGFSVPGGYTFDWLKFKTARDAYITRLNGIYSRSLTGSNIEILNGRIPPTVFLLMNPFANALTFCQGLGLFRAPKKSPLVTRNSPLIIC